MPARAEVQRVCATGWGVGAGPGQPRSGAKRGVSNRSRAPPCSPLTRAAPTRDFLLPRGPTRHESPCCSRLSATAAADAAAYFLSCKAATPGHACSVGAPMIWKILSSWSMSSLPAGWGSGKGQGA